MTTPVPDVGNRGVQHALVVQVTLQVVSGPAVRGSEELLEVVDAHCCSPGGTGGASLGSSVVLSGDIVISLAGVDLVEVRLHALIMTVRSQESGDG